MIPNEDRLLAELEAAPTLWAAADTADRLVKSGTNPVYPIIARLLRRFSFTTWSKKPRHREEQLARSSGGYGANEFPLTPPGWENE